MSVQIGMDTPQVRAELLDRGMRALDRGPGAVLGPASDGGWWALGLREPSPSVFDGVPMSTDRTLEAQRRRLDALGRRPAILPTLRDVDRFDDAIAVARELRGSRFAAAVRDVVLAGDAA